MPYVYVNTGTDGNNNIKINPTIDSSKILDWTNNTIFDNYFIFDLDTHRYIDISSLASNLTNSFSIGFKIKLSNFMSNGQFQHIFYARSGTLKESIQIEIRYGDATSCELYAKFTNSSLDSTAIEIPNIITSDDLNREIPFELTIQQGTPSTCKIYKDDVFFNSSDYTVRDAGITDSNAEILIGKFTNYTGSSYYSDFVLKDYVITDGILSSTDITAYNNGDLLTNIAKYVYVVIGQNYDGTILNIGSEGASGNGVLYVDDNDYESFFSTNTISINSTSFHKMFDENISNNILTTNNLNNLIFSEFTIPTCDYLYDRMLNLKTEAKIKAEQDTNYTFSYDINDDYYTNYICCGTRNYVPWFFLYDSRHMVDTTTGYCEVIDLMRNNTVQSTILAEYGKTSGSRLWMNNFQRKLFGGHKISTQTIYDDVQFDVQLHRTTKTYTTNIWLHTWGTTQYDSVFNICGDSWGIPYANHFIDPIDTSYDGHRCFELKISNNYNIENGFNEINTSGSVYSLDSSNTWNDNTIALRFNKVGDYYKKINPGAMKITHGLYQIFFDYKHTLQRENDYVWNNIPLKKIVTLGYIVYIVNTSTSKYTVFKTHIEYDDGEIDMTSDPNTDGFFKYGGNSSYSFINLPDLANDNLFYVISPIYSNIILAGQTETTALTYPTYKKVGGAPDRMEFNSIVPTKSNTSKLIPKTRAKIHFKRLLQE